jgi:Protein of unknown function (DUF3592)
MVSQNTNKIQIYFLYLFVTGRISSEGFLSSNQKLLPFVGLFGLMVLLGGVVFLLDGGWKTWRQSQHRNWPIVDSRVESCSISRVWRRRGRRGNSHLGVDTRINCRLGYQADGLTREIDVSVGQTVFTSPAWQYPRPKVTQATQNSWLALHPAGSTLPIHVDPSNPVNISLIGVDDELQSDSPPQRLWFGGLLAVVGFAIFTAVRRQIRKATANAPPDQPEAFGAGNPPQ